MADLTEYAEHAVEYAEDRGLPLGQACAEVSHVTDEVTAAEIMEEIENTDGLNIR